MCYGQSSLENYEYKHLNDRNNLCIGVTLLSSSIAVIMAERYFFQLKLLTGEIQEIIPSRKQSSYRSFRQASVSCYSLLNQQLTGKRHSELIGTSQSTVFTQLREILWQIAYVVEYALISEYLQIIVTLLDVDDNDEFFTASFVSDQHLLTVRHAERLQWTQYGTQLAKTCNAVTRLKLPVYSADITGLNASMGTK